MLQNIVEDAELNVGVIRRLLCPWGNPCAKTCIECERGRNENERELGSKCHYLPFNKSSPPEIYAGQWAFPVRPSYDTGGSMSLQEAFPAWLLRFANTRLFRRDHLPAS